MQAEPLPCRDRWISVSSQCLDRKSFPVIIWCEKSFTTSKKTMEQTQVSLVPKHLGHGPHSLVELWSVVQPLNRPCSPSSCLHALIRYSQLHIVRLRKANQIGGNTTKQPLIVVWFYGWLSSVSNSMLFGDTWDSFVRLIPSRPGSSSLSHAFLFKAKLRGNVRIR